MCVALVFGRAAWNGFVDYDTNVYITTNPRVLGGLSWENVRWAFSDVYAANWHPLTWIAHMTDVSLFGLWPGGHHLVSVGWHAANAVLVLLLFERFGASIQNSLFAALLFALHPLRAESVAWVVERKDLLCAFFALAALHAWISWTREARPWKYAAALALFACSLMSKPMLITLPCVLLLLDVWPLARTARGWQKLVLEKLPFLALSVASAVITVKAQAAMGAVQDLSQTALVPRIENALHGYASYLGAWFWPSGLAFHYPFLPKSELPLAGAIGAAVVLIVSIVALRTRQRAPWLLVGWLFFLGTLVPVIGLVQVGAQSRADRFTYLPSLGLCVMLLWSLDQWVWTRWSMRMRALLASSVLALLAFLCWRQVGTWHDTETLCQHALDVTESNYVAHDVLGIALVEQGQVDEGIAELRSALAIQPTDPDALANLGAALARTGRNAEAETVLRHLLALSPGRAQAHAHLGGVLYVERHYAEAKTELEEALRLQPDHVGALSNLGLAREQLGDLAGSEAAFRSAIHLRPDFLAPRLSLARMFLRAQRVSEARTELAAVLKLSPSNVEALRGETRASLIDHDERNALHFAERALVLVPDSAPALADVAWILSLASDPAFREPKRALELAQRAVNLVGERSPQLLDALAAAQAANGKFAEAVQSATKALELARATSDESAPRIEKRLTAYKEQRLDRDTAR